MNRSNRIEILDGLRVIAILLVMLYHFYSRFEGQYYAYSFKSPEIFRYGYLGVELFFVISGFVITLTLTKCDSFIEFIKRRFLRLIPGMLVCSIVTFLFVSIFDTNDIFVKSKSLINLVVSNTFVSPELINAIFNTKFQYVDGAYWSLWVELQFYVLAGALFFLSKKFFLRNYSVLAIIGVALYIFIKSHFVYNRIVPIIGEELFSSFQDFFNIFLIFKYSLWFLAGIIVNKLFFETYDKRLLIGLIAVFVLQMAVMVRTESASGPVIYNILFSIAVLSIFLLLLYKQESILFLANSTLSKIGVASYSIYLIHENIGVVIINQTSHYFGSLDWLLPLILIILFSLFGLLSYKYLEMPLGKRLKGILFKQNSPEKLSFPLSK